MYLGEFIQWLGCWFYMGCWVIIYNISKWWSMAEPTMNEGAPFRINIYMSRKISEVILSSLGYTDRNYFKYNDGFLHMRQME